jgi:hypothetical protein
MNPEPIVIEPATPRDLEECPVCFYWVRPEEIDHDTYPGLCRRCVSNFATYGTD